MIFYTRNHLIEHNQKTDNWISSALNHFVQTNE